MSRGFAAENLAALEANIVRPIYFAALEFTSTTLHLCSSQNDIDYNSNTWLGNGLFYSVDPIKESEDQRANNCVIKISGDDTTTRSLILADSNQSKFGTVYIGFLDLEHNLVANPEIIFYGNFSSASLDDSGDSSMFSLEYENELLEQKKVQEFRYSDFSQKALFPDDTGFRYASAAEDWDGWWGTAEKIKFIKKRKVDK